MRDLSLFTTGFRRMTVRATFDQKYEREKELFRGGRLCGITDRGSSSMGAAGVHRPPLMTSVIMPAAATAITIASVVLSHRGLVR